jgi:hypothetical protein
MKKRTWIPVFIACAVLALGSVEAGAQAGGSKPAGSQPGNAPGALLSAETLLPLSRVVLFSSGVGYFQREGTVEGNASVELSFRTSEINDLLKSLVLRDLDGGQVTGVNYASRDPVARTLRSFAIDLTGDPDLAGVLAQARGEPLEVTTSETARGTLLGVEKRPAGEGLEETWLNLLSERGLRSIPLSQVREVRFLNEELDRELRAALDLLAQSHSQDRKRVVLGFTGKGRRRVQVGYLLETPVWKTSYRLVLGAEQSHFLQGWAIVENTTDQDWRGVKLSLVSGRPVSFVMDLYQPLYLPRPVVVPEMYAGLRPQLYEENLAATSAAEAGGAEEAPASSRAAKAAPAAASRLAEQAYGEMAVPAAAPLDLRQGVAAAARAGEAGSFFQYALSLPVSLARQESAMLPIVGQDIEGRRVSIYNEATQPKHPMLGLKLKNTTGLTLMGGPITLFEAGSYAGDAQIDSLPAGAERLISFALDLECEVAPSARSVPDRLVAVRVARGVLTSTVTYRREKLYTAKVRGTRGRELLIEHPLSPDWTLVEPKQAEERTRDAYRFRVRLPAGGSQELLVAEERQAEQTVAVGNLRDDLVAVYLKSPAVSQKVKDALSEVGKRKAELADTLRQRQEQERGAQSIRTEQSRIRQNMEFLSRDSALYKRYVALLDAQETELAGYLTEIDRLAKKEMEQRKALEEYILSIDAR